MELKFPSCIKCHRQTKSVLNTPDGFVCLTCFTSSKDPHKAKRIISHDEADIQKEFFNKLPLLIPKLPEKLVFDVPNGGYRNPIEAANLKRQGVKSGVSDVIILIPKKGFASLCLEFKTESGKQSVEQKEFQCQAESCGSKYVIVRSVAAAIETVKEYLK